MLDVREISNVTAAQWEDESLAAEGQRLDLELQRLEAETHVKQLIADSRTDCSCKTNYGETPLDAAKAASFKEIVKIIQGHHIETRVNGILHWPA